MQNMVVCFFFFFIKVTAFELENYWCEPKSIEEIRQHSKHFNLPYGDSNGCWQTYGTVK